MSRRVAIAAFACAVFALLALAGAQPCIECSACGGSNNCLAICQRTCPITVNVERCKEAGQTAGRMVAQEACDLALRYCRGGRSHANAAAAMAVLVDLQQCGNAAFGECQRLAQAPHESTCGDYFNGVGQCDANTFQNFYNGEVNERCNKEADRIEKEGPSG